MDEVLQICLETMEGHQRAIMGNMTVEEIYRDRKTFSTKVFEVASVDLHNMGIMVISYTLKDVRDEVGYLASLGQARTAQVIPSLQKFGILVSTMTSRSNVTL